MSSWPPRCPADGDDRHDRAPLTRGCSRRAQRLADPWSCVLQGPRGWTDPSCAGALFRHAERASVSMGTGILTTSTEVEPDRMVVTSVLRALRLLELWVPWSPPKVSLEGGAMSSVLVAGTPDVQAHVSANVASGRRRTALPPVLFQTPECRWRVVLGRPARADLRRRLSRAGRVRSGRGCPRRGRVVDAFYRQRWRLVSSRQPWGRTTGRPWRTDQRSGHRPSAPAKPGRSCGG